MAHNSCRHIILTLSIAAALAFCQAPLGAVALADNAKSDATQGSLSAGNTNGDKKKDADKKRAKAKELFKQADAMGAALASAQAERDAAASDLEQAIAERDATKQRLAEETARLEALQAELSEFVVDMYKQGGVTPYLDVLLRSTSYSEFLNSWNTLTLVYEQGEAAANEKREIQKQIENELSACEERITQAELALAVADAKCKQTWASQLALTAQACDVELEAAEITGDKSEIKKAREAAERAHKALDAAIAEGLAGANVAIGDGVLANPCPGGTLTSGFGYRSFDHSEHHGIDLAAPEGTPYYAAEAGTVTAATNGGADNGGAGNWIVIDHGNGLTTKYMHSLVTFVKPGDHVERGQNIGLVGSTGNSTGSHLHFQVESDGIAIDPAPFLNKQ